LTAVFNLQEDRFHLPIDNVLFMFSAAGMLATVSFVRGRKAGGAQAANEGAAGASVEGRKLGDEFDGASRLSAR
jgi:hypothetical protein